MDTKLLDAFRIANSSYLEKKNENHLIPRFLKHFKLNVIRMCDQKLHMFHSQKCLIHTKSNQLTLLNEK